MTLETYIVGDIFVDITAKLWFSCNLISSAKTIHIELELCAWNSPTAKQTCSFIYSCSSNFYEPSAESSSNKNYNKPKLSIQQPTGTSFFINVRECVLSETLLKYRNLSSVFAINLIQCAGTKYALPEYRLSCNVSHVYKMCSVIDYILFEIHKIWFPVWRIWNAH